MLTGFEPIFNKDSKVLILGSFPSVKSREQNFYYGNRQNRFWKILSICFNEPVGDSIESRKEFLLEHKIALWDIVKTCEIKGSSDSDLRCLEVADLDTIISIAKIEKIICNGAKAYEIFKKYYPKMQAICMPSTSPANVRFNIEKWQEVMK